MQSTTATLRRAAPYLTLLRSQGVSELVDHQTGEGALDEGLAQTVAYWRERVNAGQEAETAETSTQA
jgi:hypothetical protein